MSEDVISVLDDPDNKDLLLSWESVFLTNLAITGVITDSAKRAGISRANAYHHRDASKRFALEWDNAIKEANDGLRLEARRRAVEGYDKPVFYQGAQCGTIREYSDALLMFTMRARMPDEYNQRMDLTSGGERMQAPIVYLPSINHDLENMTEEYTDSIAGEQDTNIEKPLDADSD